MCEMCEMLALEVKIVGSNPDGNPVKWKDTVIASSCEFFGEVESGPPPTLHMLLSFGGEYVWAMLNLGNAPKEVWSMFGSAIAHKLGAIATLFSSETWQAAVQGPDRLPIAPSECNNRTENLIFIFETKDISPELTNFEIMRDADGKVSLERRPALEGSTVSGRMSGFMRGMPEGSDVTVVPLGALDVDATVTEDTNFDHEPNVPLGTTIH